IRLQKGLSGLLLHALDQAGAAGSVRLSVEPDAEGGLAMRLVFSGSAPGWSEPLPSQPPWRSAHLRLALAYAIIAELGGGFRMRRLHDGSTEIVILLAAEGKLLSRPV
ncbi:MAG TPA: hypothetical protein PKM23_13110, partial [bacterium]|nr:hypothetical protein [bacterium]